MLRPFAIFVSVCAPLALVAAASAQPGPPTSGSDGRAAVLPGGAVARLVVEWGSAAADNGARLLVDGAAPARLHRGSPVAGSLAVGHGALLVALAVDEPEAPFRVLLVRPGEAPGAPTRVPRPAARRDHPFAVAATPVPDGFAVFFQEVQADDPSAAHTYLLRLSPDGAPRGPAREVPVPWSLGAAAWNGAGFHLALFYPGDGRGMRLSMVSVDAQGNPQQHPDWASAAGYVTDVHLVRAGDRMLAFYRGGPGGDRLLESDTTTIRAWGTEPPAARDHGAVDGAELIALGLEQPRPRPRRVRLGG